MEEAVIHASAALKALILIDDISDFAWDAADAARRAITCALRALLALIRIDIVLNEFVADMGWALPVFDVSLVFLREIVHRRKDWVSRGLT